MYKSSLGRFREAKVTDFDPDNKRGRHRIKYLKSSEHPWIDLKNHKYKVWCTRRHSHVAHGDTPRTLAHA